MKVKSISINGFTSLNNIEERELPQTGLVAIVGANGAGKSTFLEIMGLLPWLRFPSKSDSFSAKATRRDSFAEITFDFEGSEWTAQVNVDVGANKHSQKYVSPTLINETLGIKTDGKVKTYKSEVLKHLPSESIMLASVFGSQNGTGTFGKMSTSERRKLLREMLNLDEAEQLHQRAKVHSKEIKQKIEIISAKIVSLLTQIEEVDVYELKLSESKRMLSSVIVEIDRLNDEYLKNRKRLNDCRDAKKKMELEVDKSWWESAISDEDKFIRAHKQKYDRLIQRRDSSVSISEIDKIESMISDLQNEYRANVAGQERRLTRLVELQERDELGFVTDSDVQSLTDEISKIKVNIAYLLDKIDDGKKIRKRLKSFELNNDEVNKLYSEIKSIEHLISIDKKRSDDMVKFNRQMSLRADELRTKINKIVIRDDVELRVEQSEIRSIVEKINVQVPCDNSDCIDTSECPLIVELRGASDPTMLNNRLESINAELGSIVDQKVRKQKLVDELYDVDTAISDARRKLMDVNSGIMLFEKAKEIKQRKIYNATELVDVDSRIRSDIIKVDEQNKELIELEKSLQYLLLVEEEGRILSELDQMKNNALIMSNRLDELQNGLDIQKRNFKPLNDDEVSFIGTYEAYVDSLILHKESLVITLNELSKIDTVVVDCDDVEREVLYLEDSGIIIENENEINRSRKNKLDKDIAILSSEIERMNNISDKAMSLIKIKDQLTERYIGFSELSKALSPEGIQALDIDTAAPTITEYSNEMLEHIGSKFSIELITQRKSSNGKKWIETLDVVVYDMKTDSSRELKEMSIGEQTIIEEALKLACAVIVSDRSRGKLLTLWRDESDSALSEQNKTLYPKMLRVAMELGGFEVCYLVTHTKSVEDQCDHVIKIKDGKSHFIRRT